MRPYRYLVVAAALAFAGGVAAPAAAVRAPTASAPSWRYQFPANRSGDNNSLAGVSCSSARACTATGTYENDVDVSLTLAERWNGRKWVIQRTLNPPHARNTSELDGISCRSATSCIAVGFGNSGLSLAEHWNGRRWTIQPIRRAPNGDTPLAGVSCSSGSACTAVGSYPSRSLLAFFTLAARYS